MREDLIFLQRWKNLGQTVFLFAGIVGLMVATGYFILGITGLLWGGLLGTVMVIGSWRIPATTIMRMQGARRLNAYEAPDLIAIVRELSRRARLPRTPQLYYIPSQMMNAFATGNKQDPAIAISHGLLQQLNGRELTGVLAHEMSHIANDDLRLQTSLAVISRLTRLFSIAGQFLLFLNLPYYLVTGEGISLPGILLLIFAPALTTLMMLAISRTREFDADLEAARLTGDPGGLASALERLNYYNQFAFGPLLRPVQEWMIPRHLRTHPTTRERVRRLQALKPESPHPALFPPEPIDLSSSFFRRTGFWI